VRNLHGHAVEGHGVAGVQLLAACFLNVAVDLYQAVLNDLACLRAVLYEVGELEELAEADHVIANKNFFHALQFIPPGASWCPAKMGERWVGVDIPRGGAVMVP